MTKYQTKWLFANLETCQQHCRINVTALYLECINLVSYYFRSQIFSNILVIRVFDKLTKILLCHPLTMLLVSVCFIKVIALDKCAAQG